MFETHGRLRDGHSHGECVGAAEDEERIQDDVVADETGNPRDE